MCSFRVNNLNLLRWCMYVVSLYNYNSTERNQGTCPIDDRLFTTPVGFSSVNFSITPCHCAWLFSISVEIPVSDFATVLQDEPTTVLACLGLAVHNVCAQLDELTLDTYWTICFLPCILFCRESNVCCMMCLPLGASGPQDPIPLPENQRFVFVYRHPSYINVTFE